VSLEQDLERIATAAAAWAGPGEAVAAVIPTEPSAGSPVFLVAFSGGGEEAPGSWLALDRDGAAIESWPRIRDAVSIAALCEVAEEMAGGGDLDDLRSQLVGLRLVENPPGIAEAIAAVNALEQALGRPPRFASPGYLDAVGIAVRALELALGDGTSSPFTEGMKQAPGAIEALTREVETGLKTGRP
jgi:hypothetical protein